jgi:hypothetical protein
MADASTDEESADEAASRSVASSLGMSSIEVDSRRGDDMERPLVGEYWLRFAPRRFSVGVGLSDTSLAVSCTDVSVVASEMIVDGASSRVCVSIVISRLDRRLRRLLPLPLLRRRGVVTDSSRVKSVETVTSD